MASIKASSIELRPEKLKGNGHPAQNRLAAAAGEPYVFVPVGDMPASLPDAIGKLNGRQLRIVTCELAEIAREGIADLYAKDDAAHDALAGLKETQALGILRNLTLEIGGGGIALSDADLRLLLLALAQDPAFAPLVSRAVERRMLANVAGSPEVIGALLVFLLSIRWKFRVKRSKDGKIEYDFEAAKDATPISLLRDLLGQIPGFGAAFKKAGTPGEEGK
jgi:hypothetical protein